MGKSLSSCLYKTTMLAIRDYNFKDILEAQGINTIAIYGIGMLGKALYELLKKQGINVVYGIDRDVNKHIDGLRIVPPEKNFLEKADAIIITPINDLEAIRKELSQLTNIELIDADSFLGELIIATSF